MTVFWYYCKWHMSENSRSFSPLYAVHTEEANMKILNWNLSPRAEKEKNMAKSAHNILLPLIPEKEFKHGSDEKSFYCVWIWSSTPNMLLCLLVSIDATQRRCGRTSTTVYRRFVFEDEGIIYVRAIVFRYFIQNGKISSWEYCLPIEPDWALHLIIGVHSSADRSGSIWKYMFIF